LRLDRLESRGQDTENKAVTDGTFMNFRGPHALMTGSKSTQLTALVLGWVEDWVIRSDSPDVGVAESFSRCPFFIVDSLVQDQPDEAALSMGNGPGLIVSQA
jgi:hypothetical protein